MTGLFALALLAQLAIAATVSAEDTVCRLDVFGHGARVVLTDRELEVDGDPVFAYTDPAELEIQVHRTNDGSDRRHFWHEVAHLAVGLLPGKWNKWREEDVAMFVELVVPDVLERNPWVVAWNADRTAEPHCPRD